MWEPTYTDDWPTIETVMRGAPILRGVSRAAVMSAVSIVCVLVLMPPVTADPTFTRTYWASSTVGWGDPTDGGSYVGQVVCQGGRDSMTDTGGCVSYQVPGLYDFRGDAFTVAIEDQLFGDQTWALVVIHMDMSSTPDCLRDACYFGQGLIRGTIPAEAAGSLVRVMPMTVHSDSDPCCPDGFASSGLISVTFHPTS